MFRHFEGVKAMDGELNSCRRLAARCLLRGGRGLEEMRCGEERVRDPRKRDRAEGELAEKEILADSQEFQLKQQAIQQCLILTCKR